MSIETVGVPFGEVYPPRARPGLPHKDSRTIALEKFREFIATLVFRRTGSTSGEPIPFQVPSESIYIEQPDNVRDMTFPAIVFLPGRGSYLESERLGPAAILDETIDQFAPGTALLDLGEYTESFTIEVWGSKRGERRAMMAGLETTMLSQDDSYSLRFRLPELFGSSADFWLSEREVIDDLETARNRRRGHLYAGMSVCLVQLINVTELRPVVSVQVDEC